MDGVSARSTLVFKLEETFKVFLHEYSETLKIYDARCSFNYKQRALLKNIKRMKLIS